MGPRQTAVRFDVEPSLAWVAKATGDHPGIVAFQDWIGGLPWNNLSLLAHCAARQIGFGHEPANAIYDDDENPGDEPFEGVKIIALFRDDTSVVVSKSEYDRILADFFDFAIAHPPNPLPEWWPSFLKDAAVVSQRADSLGGARGISG